jgi:hypothetical protein
VMRKPAAGSETGIAEERKEAISVTTKQL